MHLPENSSPQCPSARFLGHSEILVEHRRQICVAAARYVKKLVQAVVSAFDDTLTPVFRTFEYFLVRSFLALQIFDRTTYGIWIDTAHQFADELALPTSRASRFDSGSGGNGVEQVFRKLHFPELFLRQLDQLLAQRLQCEHLSFFRRFAGLILRHRLSYLRSFYTSSQPNKKTRGKSTP